MEIARKSADSDGEGAAWLLGDECEDVIELRFDIDGIKVFQPKEDVMR